MTINLFPRHCSFVVLWVVQTDGNIMENTFSISFAIKCHVHSRSKKFKIKPELPRNFTQKSTVEKCLYACKSWCKRILRSQCIARQKGGDLTQSYDKSPYTNRNVKRASDNTNNATKSSIKQRLRTDLGRSVGVTKATQLVWLTGLLAHLPTNRNSRVIKRTHI